MPLLDVLDDIPTDVEMIGHVLDGAEPRQVQHVAFEGVGVGPPRIGKRHVHLPRDFALKANDARDFGKDKGRPRSDGE
jgi:hypothetical protein